MGIRTSATLILLSTKWILGTLSDEFELATPAVVLQNVMTQIPVFYDALDLFFYIL
jgi:hypothetical protein